MVVVKGKAEHNMLCFVFLVQNQYMYVILHAFVAFVQVVCKVVASSLV